MPDSDDWTPTATKLPPKNVVVYTMNSAGQVRTLLYQGNLWWSPDKEMYMYYTPKFWKELDK